MTYHDLLKQERPMPPQKETAMSDSIPDLVARVQALEAKVDAIEGGQKVQSLYDFTDLAIIIGKRDGETIEDAARRVCASFEATLTRLTKERDAAVKERDEAVRLFHGIEVSYFGFGRLRAYGTSVEIRRLLARHGLAEDHGDGTFTIKEPKP
jgi:hypothetical protein